MRDQNIFFRIKKKFVTMAFSMLCVLSTFSLTYAGNGTFSNGEFNFCVSVRFNATAAQLQQIETVFQNASQVLADATDGQHRFGTVRIVNGSGASQSSEYWVHPGSGRAYATQGKYGVRGEHVNLYFQSDFQQINDGPDGDAYTIAHEHAHHAYGVVDEYSGPSGAAECAPPPDTATLNFSLMDHYFNRGGRAGAGTTYTLNEFCVSSNHDPDIDTWQEDIHGESCWETIANHPRYSATAPTGLPVDAPPSLHTVSFESCVGGLKVMLLLDRSGSMGLQDRMTFAKSGGKLFVNFLRDDDAVGVASFASSASVNYQLTTITDSSIKTAAKAAIDALVASGATNIGGGLLTALAQITAQTDCSCDELIVLLSDGDHNTGTPPSAAIPSLQDAGIAVLTVGVGSGVSPTGQATLQNIATQTGGKFFRVANSFNLVGLFFRLVAESIGSGLLTRSPLSIASVESIEFPVTLEEGTKSVTFVLSNADQADNITLSLRTPSGTIITAAAAIGDPNIDFQASPNSQAFTVQSPEAGLWNMLISADEITTGIMEVLAYADHDGVQLNVSVEKDTLVYPEVMEISATPIFNGENVVGANVTGTVMRPDGSELPIMLFDDGIREYGDSIPGDGIYSAVFDRYNEDGTYTFELQVVNSNGTTFGGEELFSFAPSNEKPVPTFTRIATATAVITGVPEFVVTTVEYGPETINLKSKGKFITAYIELPDGFNPAEIVLNSVTITAIDGINITPIPAETWPTEIGDFDNDSVADLMVKFNRSAVQQVLSPGMRKIQLEGVVAGQNFVGERSVGVIKPDKSK